MITVRPAEERGHAQHGWLDSHHTFSFADYHDPAHMGFRALRVINEDRVQPGRGFATHGHRDMEIVTYVLDGALEHKDSLGTGSIIRPGDVQRMSAGTGVMHSEFNASKTEWVHLLQIWLLPERQGLSPSYEQRAFSADDRRRGLCLAASRDGRSDSLTVHQDVDLFAALIDPGQRVRHELRPGRHTWIQVARGALRVGDTALRAGDGAAVSDEREIEIEGVQTAEILLFDLA